MFRNFTNVRQNYNSNENPLKKKDEIPSLNTINSDSISFSGKNKRATVNNTKLVMAAALLSIATHVGAQVPKNNISPLKQIMKQSTEWFNKFSHKEQKIIQKVENEALRIYQEEGVKVSPKDSTKIIDNLHIKAKHKPLVKKLLEQYEKENIKGFYITASDTLSPRKQEIKEKALKEVIDYTFDTGRILRYNDENIKAIAEKIGVKEEEIPFLKVFLKPHIQINEPSKDPNSFYNTVILGDFKDRK